VTYRRDPLCDCALCRPRPGPMATLVAGLRDEPAFVVTVAALIALAALLAWVLS
jgi:hypothetical protein